LAVLLDTGILLAYYNRKDSWHDAAAELLTREAGWLLVPSPILPEVDFLLGRELGERAQARFYEGLSDGSFTIVDLPRQGYGRVRELNAAFPGLGLGFVDAAVLAIAESLGLGRIATTDRRHFGAVRVSLVLTLLP
jgi:uncharacterized protein